MSSEDEDGHPADALIMEKLVVRSAGKKAERAEPFQFKARSLKEKQVEATPAARSKEQKRRRSDTDSDDSLVYEKDRKRKKARREPLYLNLDADGTDETPRQTSKDKSRSNHKLDFVPPRGVILYDDDDDDNPGVAPRRIRAPRYFSKRKMAGLGTKRCFKCGKTGHFTSDCPERGRREKPCVLCAAFGHNEGTCPDKKVRCWNCHKSGHLARECPKPVNSLAEKQVCQQCGDPDCAASNLPDYERAERGCTKQYTAGDLEQVLCLNCGKAGHFSCSKTTAPLPAVSCFNCGDLGHTGTECHEGQTYFSAREKKQGTFNSYRSKRGGGQSQTGYRNRESSPPLSSRPSYRQQASAPAWTAEYESFPDRYDSQASLQYESAPQLQQQYSQPAAAPATTYYPASQPHYSSYSASQPGASQYQANPLSRQQSFRAAPITLPAPERFHHSYQPFNMGAQHQSNGRQRDRSSKHNRMRR